MNAGAQPGRLVVFEGIDGAGKSVQLDRLRARLVAAGATPLCTAEPYDCPAGRRIRAHARQATPPSPETELAWFMEQRRAHVREVLAPALARGRWVLCDRYYFSSVAYQGARGLDWRKILATHEAGAFPRPDLVLLLDLAPALALARTRARARAPEPAFENLEFLTRVRELFLSIERPELARVPADADIEQVAARVAQIFDARFAHSAQPPRPAAPDALSTPGSLPERAARPLAQRFARVATAFRKRRET